MTKPIPYDDDNDTGGEEDERDMRKLVIYDDEALKMMQNWTGGQSDPLYAISSTGGWNYAWVFSDAIANIDSDLRRVKKLGRNKYQLGNGTFTKAEIDELRYIRDALQMTLDDPESVMVDEMREPPHHVAASYEPHHVADFNTLPNPPPRHFVSRRVADFNTIDDLLEHARKEGATHFLQIDDETHIYFRRSDGKYEKAEAWQKDGYWHTQAPGSRAVVPRPPRGARAIGQHAQGAAPKHFASEANDAKDVLDGLGRYLEHEGHDAAREASRIARFIRGARSERKVEEALEEVNKLIGGHGVEAIRDENAYDNYYGDVIATYVNMGDTYDATLLYDVRNNEFHITSWGDWYEQYEQQRDAEREEEAPESEDFDEDLEEARGDRYTSRQSDRNALIDEVFLNGELIGYFTGPIRYGKRTIYRWTLDAVPPGDLYPFGHNAIHGEARTKQGAIEGIKRAQAYRDERTASGMAREAPVVHDYIAVDRNDRRVAGPFRTRGEAEPHVPPGGYVKFSSARRGLPPGAPKPPSAYPMFRERNGTGMRTKMTMKHTDPDAYEVYNYDTGRMLEGLPTEELVRESLSAGDTGAVYATYDTGEARWDYVRPEDKERAERRGETVRTVYVELA